MQGHEIISALAKFDITAKEMRKQNYEMRNMLYRVYNLKFRDDVKEEVRRYLGIPTAEEYKDLIRTEIRRMNEQG